MTLFCDVASSSLVEIVRRFRDIYCLQHQGEKISLLVALIMKTVRARETSSNFYETTRHKNQKIAVFWYKDN
jgi:hypothetical protein